MAAKALGIGADVYWEADRTKYDTRPQAEPSASPPTVPQTPSSGKPALSPEAASWKQAVAFCNDIKFILIFFRVIISLCKPNSRRKVYFNILSLGNNKYFPYLCIESIL